MPRSAAHPSAPVRVVTACAGLVTLALALAARPAPARAATAPDSTARPPMVTWRMIAPAPDRLQHAGLSFSLSAGTGIASAAPWPGAGVAFALGLAKEAHDRREGRFDLADLTADAVGAVLGALASRALVR